MTVDELKTRMKLRELTQWDEFYRLEAEAQSEKRG